MERVLSYVLGSFSLLFGLAFAGVFGTWLVTWLSNVDYANLVAREWAFGILGVVGLMFIVLFSVVAGFFGFCMCSVDAEDAGDI